MITASKLRVVDGILSVNDAWRESELATGVSRADLKSDRRFKYLANARFTAYRIFRDMGFSLPEIGHLFNRHHTTIIHGLEREGNK